MKEEHFQFAIYAVSMLGSFAAWNMDRRMGLSVKNRFFTWQSVLTPKVALFMKRR